MLNRRGNAPTGDLLRQIKTEVQTEFGKEPCTLNALDCTTSLKALDCRFRLKFLQFISLCLLFGQFLPFRLETARRAPEFKAYVQGSASFVGSVKPPKML